MQTPTGVRPNAITHSSPAHRFEPDNRHPKQRLLQLDATLTDREQAVVRCVERLRLLQARQIERLYFAEAPTQFARARACRRVLAGLVEEGLLRRLERRVGGVRAGSSSHVYAVTAAGRRALAFWSGGATVSDRGVHEPGALFLAHTLAIAELYVRLVEAEREGTFELLAFDPEPNCWRPFTTRIGAQAILKPDAFVRVGVEAYEQRSFLEVDLGTHGRGSLQRKINSYIDYFRSGREQAAEGVFPRVAWVTPTTARVPLVRELIERLGPREQRLFVATIDREALAALAGVDSDAAAGGER